MYLLPLALLQPGENGVMHNISATQKMWHHYGLWVKPLLEFSSNTVIEFDQLFFGDANSIQDSSSCLVFVDLVIY